MMGYEERRAYSCLVLSCLPLISFDCHSCVAANVVAQWHSFHTAWAFVDSRGYLCIVASTASPRAYPLLRSLIFKGWDLVLANRR